MHEDIRTSQPEQSSSTAQAPLLPSQADIEATLRDLLIRFRDTAEQDSEQITRFARAGAEALLTQMQSSTWLDSMESATVLGIAEDTLYEHVRQGTIPAARGPDNAPRIHRRDLSLYQLSQQLGATEEQVTTLTPPVAWSSDISAWGFDPWDELTPG
jgi:hypothetical protein